MGPGPLPLIGDEPRERADAARNRGKVLAAAERLFAERGVECTSMDAVAAEAGLGKVLRTIGARVIDSELPVGRAHDAFDEDGDLREPELGALLAEVVGHLVREAGAPLEQAA
jgi:hypothetical protein